MCGLTVINIRLMAGIAGTPVTGRVRRMRALAGWGRVTMVRAFTPDTGMATMAAWNTIITPTAITTVIFIAKMLY